MVFVGGLEETLFPNALAINTREELEEERRLFYVAITRAKDKLWLSYANARYRFGQLQQNDPSRFLEEVPESYLDKVMPAAARESRPSTTGLGPTATSGAIPNGLRVVSPWWKKKTQLCGTGSPAGKRTYAVRKFRGQRYQQPAAGKSGTPEVRVRGGGKMEGAAHNPIATIRSEANGERRSCSITPSCGSLNNKE